MPLTVRVLPQWSRKLYTKPRHKKGYTVHDFDRQDRDGYVILVNEYNEIWWISNRHVREVRVVKPPPTPPKQGFKKTRIRQKSF